MSDITKADVSQIVRSELSQFSNDIRSIRDAVQKVDQRTNDFDETQREIKDLYNHLKHMVYQLEAIMQQVRAGDANSGMRTQDLNDTKLRVQNIEKGVAQIVQYMQAEHAAQQEESDYRK